MQGTSASSTPQRTSATQTQGSSAHPQVGHQNEMQGTSARWSPKRKTHPQQKHPHKGGIGLKTSYRIDKNKFCLGGWVPKRNTRHIRKLGAPTQRKARPQVGCPNAMQGTSASWAPKRTSARWAPKRNARHVRKMGAQMQHKARPQVGRPNATQDTSASWAPQRTSAMQTQGPSTHPQVGHPNAMQSKASPQDGRPKATQGTSASWAPQCNARHVRKLGAPTHVCNTNARHVRTSASWAPQRNKRHVRKMVSQTQNSSATKTSTQGSTRLKDKLEDG
jgi:hypothetical protein